MTRMTLVDGRKESSRCACVSAPVMTTLTFPPLRWGCFHANEPPTLWRAYSWSIIQHWSVSLLLTQSDVCACVCVCCGGLSIWKVSKAKTREMMSSLPTIPLVGFCLRKWMNLAGWMKSHLNSDRSTCTHQTGCSVRGWGFEYPHSSKKKLCEMILT